MYLFIYNYTPICCLHEFHLFPREFERSLRRNDQPGNKVCSTPSGRPTTLKRSGSDYSATIFAKILEASNVPGLQWQTGPGFRWDFCWGMMSKAQLYGDYFMNHEIRIPIKQPDNNQDSMDPGGFFSWLFLAFFVPWSRPLGHWASSSVGVFGKFTWRAAIYCAVHHAKRGAENLTNACWSDFSFGRGGPIFGFRNFLILPK